MPTLTQLDIYNRLDRETSILPGACFPLTQQAFLDHVPGRTTFRTSLYFGWCPVGKEQLESANVKISLKRMFTAS